MPVAEATTKLTVEDRELQKGLNKGVAGIRKYGKMVKQTMLAVAKAVAVVGAAAGALAWNFVQAASDFEEIRSKFRAVFKELTEEATIFVDELSESLGRSRTDLTAFMATLQDTFVPLGFARREGLKMSKTLVQLTLDLASFNNQAERDVIRDLQSAIVGNHETMRKYGVIITETSLKQEILNSGVSKSWKEVTAAEKARARMNIIIKGTADAQGDAARTSGEFAGQTRALRAAIEDVRVEIGRELMPLAKDLVGVLKDLAQNSEDYLDPLWRMTIQFTLLGNAIRQTSLHIAILAGSGLPLLLESVREKLKLLQEDWRLLNAQLEEGPAPDPFMEWAKKVGEEADKAAAKYRRIAREALATDDVARRTAGAAGAGAAPTGPLVLQKRAIRLDMGDISDGMKDVAKDFEIAVRPRFEGLTEAWKRITTEASAKETDPAEKTADATEETAEEVKKVKESSKKIEDSMVKTVEILGSISDSLEPIGLVATYGD